MSITLYKRIADECSVKITRRYSTSFTLGIKMLDKNHRQAIYSIYGYVRLADEIVDTMHDYDRKVLLEEFERDTWLAMERGISTNPVIYSFQLVVKKYNISHELIAAFIESMVMDLEDRKYDPSLYEKYIYGSAEVVGLMCLKVFCNGDPDIYKELTPAARSLGAAFQKVNFLRDMKDDFVERGRVYFPNLDIRAFDVHAKKMIEADIQQDFDDALAGIRKLPEGSRIGVYLAYRYYTKLFRRIRHKMPAQVLQQRIRISNATKISILARSFARYKMNLL